MTNKTRVWFEGRWHEGNIPVAGPRTHGLWLGSTVFDGARRFEGVMPDLDRHIERLLSSAKNLGLKPLLSFDEIEHLVTEGVQAFDDDAALYIKMLLWPESGGYQGAVPNPDSTRFALCIYEDPMPVPGEAAITLSPYRRPTIRDAPVDVKAACLYPNTSRALQEAGNRGFQNCVMLDQIGNVCELASANIFFVKGGTVYTPIPNGCFLNGITRQRVISLLRAADYSVQETVVTYPQLKEADEIFSTGNFAKVMPVTRIDDRPLKDHSLTMKARELYWKFVHECIGQHRNEDDSMKGRIHE